MKKLSALCCGACDVQDGAVELNASGNGQRVDQGVQLMADLLVHRSRVLLPGRRQADVAGHAFMQNLRRGHCELSLDVLPAWSVAVAFTELARAI